MKTKHMLISGIFAAVICIFSVITVPIGTIPLTFSLFAVCLCSVVLGVRRALLAVVAYIALGCVGVPVFAGFNAGFGVFLGPTGGYIWSYLLYPLITGFVSHRADVNSKIRYICVMSASLICLVMSYLIGTLQFSLMQSISFAEALYVCVIPFVVFDIVKIICAVIVGIKVKDRICLIM